ncbi:MAG: hypothetical protein LBK62_01880 [Treponema sp.]|jgi:hypothetical protein|nr:hypothetical protein [Treponema sp.]
MYGFLYRMAICFKEFGERHKLPWLIRLGLWIRERVMNCKKIKITYKTMDVLDWVFTVIFTALAFWADWRIGLAFIVYDLSRVCEKAKDELQSFERIKGWLKNNSAHGGNDE